MIPGPRRVAHQVAELSRATRAARHHYGAGTLRTVRAARRLRRRQGYEYAEALRVGLLDPAIPAAERDLYVSRHASLEAAAPLNHGNVVTMLNGDKGIFYRYCDAWGLPTPALHAIIDRRGSSWSPLTGVFRHRDGFEEMLGRAPGDVVVKPSVGGMGDGVRVLSRDAQGLAHFDGRRTTAGELWDEIMSDPEYDEWVVQERLHNHHDLVAMGGDSSLHGLRVVTLVDREGRPDLLFAFLKLAIAGGPSDNFLGGASGNAVAPVRLDDGTLEELLLPAPPPRPGFARSADSPLTGARVAGAAVPHWDEVRRIVLEAAPRFLPTRGLGWDVALTPEGPTLLEANTRWLLLPLPTVQPVYQRILWEAL